MKLSTRTGTMEDIEEMQFLFLFEAVLTQTFVSEETEGSGIKVR